MIFGCDLCQEACPVNEVRGDVEPDKAFAPNPNWSSLDPVAMLLLDEKSFQEMFQGSPIRRATSEGLRRNACVVLGNLGDAATIPALINVLDDPSALVRGHAAWALGRLGGNKAKGSLKAANRTEFDPLVLDEINAALDVV